MTLNEICKEIAMVEEGLMYGEISFCYDNMMSAMKPGHPADILDEILSLIGWDVFSGKVPELEKVKATLEELELFQEGFQVDLELPIGGLKKYIEEKEGQSNE